MLRGITNFLMRREQAGRQSLSFEQVKELLKLLNRQTVITVSEPDVERKTNPADAIETVVELLKPFGRYYFDAEHNIFLDRKDSKTFHYLDLCIGDVTESGNKMPAFYKTTLSYTINHH